MCELMYLRGGLVAIEQPPVVVACNLHLRRLERPQRHDPALPVALDLSKGVAIQAQVALERLAKLERGHLGIWSRRENRIEAMQRLRHLVARGTEAPVDLER